MVPKDYLGNRSKSVRQLVWIGNKHVMIVNADGGTKWNIYTYDLGGKYRGFGKLPIFESTGDVYANCDSNIPVIENLTETKSTGSFNQVTGRSKGTTKLCKYDGTTLYETGMKHVIGEDQDKKLHDIVASMVEP